MRLDDLDPSSNVEDMGRGGGGGFGGGGNLAFMLLPLLFRRGMGCGGLAIVGLIAAFFFFTSGGGPVRQGARSGSADATPCDTAAELFSCRVLASTEQTWSRVFQASGRQYQPATLRFYQESGQSGCGAAMAAMGPFYCPTDTGVYLDTGFFDELDQRFGAAGDFAQAYVIAHEVGHHIQDLAGTLGDVQQRQRGLGESEGNALQVRVELQADCYAGVWAGLNRDRLEPGDIEEGLRAAAAIGDDRLQGEGGGRVRPESFTHGTSEQRMRWLRRGIESGDPAACDTFGGVA